MTRPPEARIRIVPTPVGVNRNPVTAFCLRANIVPTPVGVNREKNAKYGKIGDCPHTRGGEPNAGARLSLFSYIVPTPVGVNRYGY